MDAREVLEAIGAPERLLRHAELVSEAAAEILAEVRSVGVAVDEAWVLTGAMLHDAGKALHPGELDAPGSAHEEAGEALLLARGVDPRVARCCVSHAQWRTMTCSLEELLVALADTVWKGVRRADLEGRVIDEIAARAGRERWSLFVSLDSAFERISDGGTERLLRSRITTFPGTRVP